jgi:hypothetical protein
MSVSISGQQAQVIVDMLNDPEQLSSLSGDQMIQMSSMLRQYQTEVGERNERLRIEGLNDEQIARVNAAGHDVEPNTGQPEKTEINLKTGDAKYIPPLGAEGIVDGAKLAVRGVLDLAKDLQVTFGLPEEDRDEWKKATAAWRTEQRIEQMEEFGQLPASGYEMAGNIAPWLFALPSAAESFIGLIAKRGLQGGAMGGTTVQGADEDLSDRLGSVALGTLFGVASAIPSIVSGAKKHVAQSFTRNFNNESAQQADRVQEYIRQMTGDESFQLSIAQSTGGRGAVGIEVAAAADKTKAAQNNNLNILSRHFFDQSKKMAEKGLSPGEIAVAMRNTLAEIHRSVSKQAQNAWRKNHAELVAKYGDDIVIRGDDYLAKIDKLIAERADRLANPGGKGLKGLKDYRALVDVEVNPVISRKNAAGDWQLFDRRASAWLPERSPDKMAVDAVARQKNSETGIGVDATLRILKGQNSLIGGTSTIGSKATPGSDKELGRALLANFTDSLESKSANTEAAAAIAGMRAQYKEQMAYLQAVDDSIVQRIFGGKKLPENPGKAIDQIIAQSPEDLAATVRLLENHNPVLLSELRAAHYARIHGGSLTGKNAAVDTEVDLDRFLTRLEGSMEGSGRAGWALHTPAARADIKETAQALRIIKNKYFKGIVPGGPRVDDIAINLVSRSPEFMARFVARVMVTGKSLEAGMLDQTFRTAMKTIAEEPLGSKTLQAAMVYLTMWTNQAQHEADARADFAEKQRVQDNKSALQEAQDLEAGF